MKDVAVIMGDGVGPELVKATMRVVTATGLMPYLDACGGYTD